MLKSLVFFISLCSLVYSQSEEKVTEVIYEITRDDFGFGTTNFTYQLLVDSDNYQYTFQNLSSTSNLVGKTIKRPYNYHFGKINENVDYQVTNVYHQKEYTIIDSIPTINWEIDKKSFKLKGFNCKMGIGNYRGRVITAYFTDSVPITIGPNNLNGLPGVIIFATTNDNSFTFEAKTIKTIKKPDYFIDYLSKDDIAYNITKREFVEINDIKQAKIRRIARLRMEKQKTALFGKKVEVKNKNMGRSSLELFYEWELEESEKN